MAPGAATCRRSCGPRASTLITRSTTLSSRRRSSTACSLGRGTQADEVQRQGARRLRVEQARAADCIKTSVKVHIDHYREHAGRDPLLAPTLRLAKRWRHWQELDGFQSFHLELMLSCLVDRDGPAPTLEDSLRRLFLFIARDL